jgi:hypothetical protein
MRNGGLACALAIAQRRRNEDDQGAYTTERLKGGNAQYAIGLGLGVPKKPKKPKYDLLELGKQMDHGRRNQKGVLQRRQAGFRDKEKESHCCFEHGLQSEE